MERRVRRARARGGRVGWGDGERGVGDDAELGHGGSGGGLGRDSSAASDRIGADRRGKVATVRRIFNFFDVRREGF